MGTIEGAEMTSYLDWQVGDRVVCVDVSSDGRYDPPAEKFVPLGRNLNGLELDRVYIIRSICDFYGVPSIRVHGIVRPLSRKGIEVPYAAARFRKIQPRKTSIAVFEAILHGKPVKVGEDA